MSKGIKRKLDLAVDRLREQCRLAYRDGLVDQRCRSEEYLHALQDCKRLLAGLVPRHRPDLFWE